MPDIGEAKDTLIIVHSSRLHSPAQLEQARVPTCRHEACMDHSLCKEEALCNKVGTVGARRYLCNVGAPIERGISFSVVPPCKGAGRLYLRKSAMHDALSTAISQGTARQMFPSTPSTPHLSAS